MIVENDFFNALPKFLKKNGDEYFQMAYMQQQQPAYAQPYGAPPATVNNGVQG